MKRLALLFMTLAACGDDDGTFDAGFDAGADAQSDAMPDTMGDGGMDALDAAVEDSGDAGPPPICPTGSVVLDPVAGAVDLAVVSGDFTSTVISLLAADGSVTAANWINSGTTAPGLTATLGGDVVLATQSPAGTLGIVDRFGADVVTRFCVASGSLIGQLRAGADGFSANPQDMVVIGERGFISRYEQNADTSAAPADRGSDLIGFDARTMTRNDERVDLSEVGGSVVGSEGAMVDILPRPARITQAGAYLVVGLERLPADLFGSGRGFGEGTVAIVSLADLSVTGHVLTGTANCGQVVPVPGADDEVVVACKGYSNVAFGDVAGERATSGLFRLRVGTDGSVTELDAWRVSDESAAAVNSVVALGGDLVAGVATGTFGETGDVLSLTALGSGEQDDVLDSEEAFVLGQGALVGDVLFVPDATTGVAMLQRVQLGDDPVVLMPVEATDALPPRSAGAL